MTIAQESEQDRDERVRKLFEKLDVNKAGTLDLEGLRNGLRRINHPLQNAEQMLKDVLKACDTSGDGLIQFEEFKVFVEETEKHLLDLFRTIDRDQNGKLDRSELAAALKLNGIYIDGDKLEQFFDELDANNDGHISFEEWRDFLVFIPQFERGGMNAIYSYYLATVNMTAEGDVVLSQDTISSLGYFVAGGVAGVVSRTATAPFDRLRVYLIAKTDAQTVLNTAVEGVKQVSPRRLAEPLIDACKDLWRAGGVRSLFAGNGLNVIKILPESAIKFGSYEAAKRTFARLEGVEDVKQISPLSRFLAGGVGGVVSQFAVYPIDTLKFRMQCEVVQGGLRGNRLISATAKKLWAQGGLVSYYRGLPLGLVGIFPYAAIDLGTFEWMKRSYAKSKAKTLGCSEDDVKLSNMVVLGIGATSGSIGASVVYPINLLRTRLQAQGTTQHPQTYTGMWDVMRRTIQHEGFRGLFKGLTPNLLKVIPAVSISYLVYENSKVFMGLR